MVVAAVYVVGLLQAGSLRFDRLRQSTGKRPGPPLSPVVPLSFVPVSFVPASPSGGVAAGPEHANVSIVQVPQRKSDRIE